MEGDRSLPPMPVDWVALGHHLTRFRHGQDLSLAEAASRIGRSGSSLHRYETGQKPVPDAMAGALDELYATRGWIVASVAALRFARWAWHPRGCARRRWLHRWDAEFDGQVWIGVVPPAGRAPGRRVIRLAWGAWTRDLAVSVPVEGLVLVTGKDLDAGPSPVIEVVVQPSAVVFFGVHEPPTDGGALLVDIRSGWLPRGTSGAGTP